MSQDQNTNRVKLTRTDSGYEYPPLGLSIAKIERFGAQSGGDAGQTVWEVFATDQPDETQRFSMVCWTLDEVRNLCEHIEGMVS